MTTYAVPTRSVLPTQRATSSSPSGTELLAHLGPDGDAGRSRQSVAEAVRASRHGDIVIVQADAVERPTASLTAFLAAAGQAALLRGARFQVTPADAPVARELRLQGLYPTGSPLRG